MAGRLLGRCRSIHLSFFSFFFYFFLSIFTPIRWSSFTVDTLAILSLGKATANAIGKVTNVRVQAMPSRVPLLGHANEIRKVHTWRRLVPLRAHLFALSYPLDAGYFDIFIWSGIVSSSSSQIWEDYFLEMRLVFLIILRSERYRMLFFLCNIELKQNWKNFNLAN